MTKEEIKINNRTIAEYMGYIYYHKGIDVNDDYCGGMYTRTEIFSKVPILSKDYEENDQYYFADVPNPDFGKLTGERKWRDDIETLGWDTINSTKYITDLDYDWNWNSLMPVIDKIEASGYDFDMSKKEGSKRKITECRIWYSISNWEDIYNASESRIEAAYKTVVGFIKWENAWLKTEDGITYIKKQSEKNG